MRRKVTALLQGIDSNSTAPRTTLWRAWLDEVIQTSDCPKRSRTPKVGTFLFLSLPAASKMQELWQSDDPSKWRVGLDERHSKIEQHGKEGLAELDRWMEDDLPASIESRKPDRHVTAAELVRTVEWKLKRGQHRPKLLQWAREAKAEEVEAASRSAFLRAAEAAQAPDEAGFRERAGEALAAMTVLKGVGPATASALLTAAEPCCPFMSDEAMAAALGPDRQYTPKRYLDLAVALRQKAQALNASSEPGKGQWTAQAVERALHSWALQPRAAKPSRKRKQAD